MIVNKTVEGSDHNGELKKVEEDGSVLKLALMQSVSDWRNHGSANKKEKQKTERIWPALLKQAYFQC